MDGFAYTTLPFDDREVQVISDDSDSDAPSDAESDSSEASVDDISDASSDSSWACGGGLAGNTCERSNRSPEDLRSQIWLALSKLKTSNTFAYSTSSAALPNPGLYVKDHGLVGVPLSSIDAQVIISKAKRPLPVERDAKRLNTTNHRCWELDSAQVTLKNPRWETSIQTIVLAVNQVLDITQNPQNITAELDKLVLNESRISPNLDEVSRQSQNKIHPEDDELSNGTESTEQPTQSEVMVQTQNRLKMDDSRYRSDNDVQGFSDEQESSDRALGIFGKLTVCLPSPHTGGKIVISHGDRKHEVNTSLHSEFDATVAACFSDAKQETQPVISGNQLSLVYSLIRKPGSEKTPLPSAGVLSGQIEHLSHLLEKYTSRLENNGYAFPNFLLHKLEHRYKKSNFKVNSLQGQDISQVQHLARLSKKLGYGMYLAKSELEVTVHTPYYEEDYRGGYGRRYYYDESSSPSPEPYESDRVLILKNISELDGSRVAKKLIGDGADECFIDPTPRDKGKADEEEPDDSDNPEGEDNKYYYRDCVVVLVPPSRKTDFLLQPDTRESKGLELLRQFRADTYSNATKKPQLERICAFMLGQTPDLMKPPVQGERYGMLPRPLPELNPETFEEVVSTLLEIGRSDLFRNLLRSIGNRAAIENASYLGSCAAQLGLDDTTRLCFFNVLLNIPDTDARFDFMKDIEEGWNNYVADTNTEVSSSIRSWLQDLLVDMIMKEPLFPLTAVKGLGEVCYRVDKKVLDHHAKAILLDSSWKKQYTFLQAALKASINDTEDKDPAFIHDFIQLKWERVELDQGSKDKIRIGNTNATLHLPWGELKALISMTTQLMPSFTFIDHMIPAITPSIPNATPKTASSIFVPLIRTIIEDKGDIVPSLDSIYPTPPKLKLFVQAMLKRYIGISHDPEPEKPDGWKLPAHNGCHCAECIKVNKFLRSPTEHVLELSIVVSRRAHLDSRYTKIPDTSFDVSVIKESLPYVWKIEKNHSQYEKSMKQWKAGRVKIKEFLKGLAKGPHERVRLNRYLEPNEDAFMQAELEDIPEIDISEVAQPLGEIDPNIGSSNNGSGGRKRTRDAEGVENKRPRKRSKSTIQDSEDDEDLEEEEQRYDDEGDEEDEEEEIEVMDLTNM